MKKAIVVDIDGVILDSSKVLCEIEKLHGGEKWNYFNKYCNSDDIKLMPNIKPFIYSFGKDVDVIISTARSEFIRPQTARKLTKHRVYFSDMLMRDYNDYRVAVEVKKDHIKKIRDEFGYEIIAFIDDEIENLNMAKEMGILSLRAV